MRKRSREQCIEANEIKTAHKTQSIQIFLTDHHSISRKIRELKKETRA